MNKIKNRILKLITYLLNFLYKLLFYFLILCKYLSFIGFFAFFIFFFKTQPYIIINKDENICHMHVNKCDFFKKDYLKYDGYLLKSYSYYFKNQNIYINNNFQKIKFFLNNNYYDEDGNIVKNYPTNHVELLNRNISFNIIKINNLPTNKTINEAFQIYQYIKNIEGKLNNVKISLDYIYFRWNVILEYENRIYTIKLPEHITSSTLKKIKYLEENIHILNENIKIIDVRFHNIILAS